MDAGESQAFQIALKTLRERCHYLQHKLEAVEEENCKLKLQLSQDLFSKSPRLPPEVASLQEQITLLTKEKSQLLLQVQMVAAENHTLWSQLSKLSGVNQNLGSRLSMLADTINRHESNLGLSINQINFSKDQKDLMAPECSKESLEEISLKLINGILLEKTELENQYAQMVDLQNDNETVNVDNLCFSLSTDDDGVILNSITKHVQKLNQIKEMLYDQKNDLTSAIENLKNVQINKVCNNCVNTENNANINLSRTLNSSVNVEQRGNDGMIDVSEVGQVANEVDNQVPDKICPMCGVTFTGTFQEFHDHVSDHFVEEHETFELIP